MRTELSSDLHCLWLWSWDKLEASAVGAMVQAINKDQFNIMINRSAIIVRPKQPYIDWASSLDDSGMVPSPSDERTVYLMPEYEDDEDGLTILAIVWEFIFDSELENWHLIVEDWPKNRTFPMFIEWFEIDMHSMIVDMCDMPLVDSAL